MILADKIINERKKNGWSQEDLADMLDVSRQSVSKWEGAQSVPDLAKILKLAEVFGVSTDYLLKDEIEADPGEVRYDTSDVVAKKRKVTMDEAAEYISLRKTILPKIAAGVFLCITCPVILILLAGLSDSKIIALSEGAVTAIGLTVLFIHIAVAVFIFVTNGPKLSRYDFLEKEEFETEYGVDGMAKERLAGNEAKNSRALVTGVMLCILSPLGIVLSSVLEMKALTIGMVCLLLLMVGLAVYLFISVVAVNSSYKVLLQMGDYAPAEKTKNTKLESVTGVYWMIIVAAYLATSFFTGAWDRTWIIWPVAGVLFAVIKVIAGAFIKKD